MLRIWYWEAPSGANVQTVSNTVYKAVFVYSQPGVYQCQISEQCNHRRRLLHLVNTLKGVFGYTASLGDVNWEKYVILATYICGWLAF